MGKITLPTDVDIQGILQTDNYLQQDSLSALGGVALDGGAFYDIGTITAGTIVANEESPADQWHVEVGDSSGTDSYCQIQHWALKGGLATMQIEVKFDKLGTAFAAAATYDCFYIALLNGTCYVQIMISKDSVWLYDSTNAWVQQFAYAFDNTSWWTIRILFFQNAFIMYVRDDDGPWVRAGTGDNADPNTGFPGIYKLGAYNYPTSPATTEFHLRNTIWQQGLHYPK